ncbi:MAG: transposase, partial [Deltaproteobacteria bacterium]
MKKITNPHDAFFKETFSKKAYAADFLEGVLPAPLRAKLDLDTLRLENASYIDERLAEHFSDLVYGCTWQGSREIRVSLLF